MSFTPQAGAKVTYQKGSTGFGVCAVEVNLGRAPTGKFDAELDLAVRAYQKAHRLQVDGDVGPLTQQSMAAQFMGTYRTKYQLPGNMLASITKLESGFHVAATNFRSPGYVDLGWCQIRIPYPDPDPNRYIKTVTGHYCFDRTGAALRQRFELYMSYGKVTTRRAWELAVLAHNYPSAALTLAKGLEVSNEPAQWVMQIGVKGVVTPAQWCAYYISVATSLVTWSTAT